MWRGNWRHLALLAAGLLILFTTTVTIAYLAARCQDSQQDPNNPTQPTTNITFSKANVTNCTEPPYRAVPIPPAQ